MPNEKKTYKYYTKTLRCPDGSRKYIRGKTKKELEEKVKKAQAELESGVNIGDDTTFGQLAQLWIDLYKRPRNKPQSLDNILSLLNYHLMPHLAHLRVRDIRPANILFVLSESSHLSRSVQSVMLSYLRSIFAMAVDNGIIAKSPVPASLKPSATPSPEKEPLTPEECTILLNAVDKRAMWLQTYVRLCLFAGLRSGEACGLCWDCVDLDQGIIQVRRQVITVNGKHQLSDILKTDSSRRDIPIPPELVKHLRLARATTRTFTVSHSAHGTLLNPANAGVAVSRMDLGFRVHPHLLRHTYATRLVEAGLDIKEVQYLLGHSTPTMTLRVYAHYDRKSRAETTAKRIAGVSFTA